MSRFWRNPEETPGADTPLVSLFSTPGREFSGSTARNTI
jgi:hypothetical protein